MTSVDYSIIAAYMIGIVAAGVFSRGKQESAEDYFSSSGNATKATLGPLLIGLSIAATFFSGISFVAYPSLTIAEGLRILFILAALVPCTLLVAYWFIPAYLAVAGSSPYGIIAERLGSKVRSVTSILYILLRLGWMASLIYAPTIVLLSMLGLGDEWRWPIILIVGLSSTAYTVVSGLRGVIVTDAIQMLVILGSLALATGIALTQVPWEPSAWFTHLQMHGKITTPSFSMSMTERFTVWGILFGIGISNIGQFVADQMSLQRYISSSGVADARRAFLLNIVGVAAVLILLVCTGIAILLWQVYNPAVEWPSNSDGVFPMFVATVLPVGMRGLMAAAILAATMSSITSGINALAGAVTIDFVKPARSNKPAHYFLSLGRRLSVVIGLVATLAAGLVSGLGTIFDVSQAILGVFLGPILGVIMLAMLKRRAGQKRVFVAIALSCIAGVCVAFSPIQSIWVTCVGFVSFMLIAFPNGRRGEV